MAWSEFGVLGGQASGLLDRVLVSILFHLIDCRIFQINPQTQGHHQGVDQNISQLFAHRLTLVTRQIFTLVWRQPLKMFYKFSCFNTLGH